MSTSTCLKITAMTSLAIASGVLECMTNDDAKIYSGRVPSIEELSYTPMSSDMLRTLLDQKANEKLTNPLAGQPAIESATSDGLN